MDRGDPTVAGFWDWWPTLSQARNRHRIAVPAIAVTLLVSTPWIHCWARPSLPLC